MRAGTRQLRWWSVLSVAAFTGGVTGLWFALGGSQSLASAFFAGTMLRPVYDSVIVTIRDWKAQ